MSNLPSEPEFEQAYKGVFTFAIFLYLATYPSNDLTTPYLPLHTITF